MHIDVDAAEIGRNHRNSLALQADAKLGVAALLEALPGSLGGYEWDYDSITLRTEAWWESGQFKTLGGGDGINPQDLMRELASRLEDRDVVVSDASLSSGWAASHWRVGAPGRRILAPRGLAGLGWGLPAAVGAALAMRDRAQSGRIVCLAGDGAWGYSSAEVETLVRFGLPVSAIVLNNGTLAWNKHEAIERYGDAGVSMDFGDMRWSAAAEALGARGVRVDQAAELGEALDVALTHSGPSVLEIVSSEVESPVQADAAYTTTDEP